MKRYLQLWPQIAGVLIVVVLIGYYEYTLWDECLNTNSFWYCMRVLGK